MAYTFVQILKTVDVTQIVNPLFANLRVDFWVEPRKLGFSQPTLCLYHDSIRVGSPILDALKELKNEKFPGRRKLTFDNRLRERALSSLRLMLVPRCDDLQVMSIKCDSDAATIEMTDEGLGLLIDACATWLDGEEDFGVSPRHSTLKPKDFGELDRESGELWFWGPGYAGP